MTKLYATTGGFWPMFSPDGRYVLAGNGVLKLIDLETKTEQHIATELRGFLRGGWFGPRQILIQHDEGAWSKGDGFIYSYDVLTGRLIPFRSDANYRGSTFRASVGHWCVVQYHAGICLDGVWLGPGYNYTDLSGLICVSNYEANGVGRVRIIDCATRAVLDVVPKVGPNVVRASRDHVSYGYFGPSALRVPSGTQGFVNLTAGEGPCKVVFGDDDVRWVCTGAEVDGKPYTFARPLGHTQPTAVVFPHAANAIDAMAIGTKFRVACDTTSGHLEIWEASFTDPLVAIPVPPPVKPPDPPIDPPVDPPVAKATIVSYDKNVTLPSKARAVARVTQGKPTHFRWQFKDHDTWVTNAENPVADLDHGYVFPNSGQFPIRLQTVVKGKVTDTTSSSSRVVTVQPAPVDPPPNPNPDRPHYDTFVQSECPAVATTFAEVNGNPPGAGNMGHNSYRRLAQGWTADEVQQGIHDPHVNYNRQPWFGWVPVDYTSFVNDESPEVADAYRAKYPGQSRPTAGDMGHTAWRRFAEFWTHADIVRDIKGEPLQDGGAGGSANRSTS